MPSLHSFRHTRATRALLNDESVDEVAFLLGHKNANITRAVYVREVNDAARRAARRARVPASYADVLAVPTVTSVSASAAPEVPAIAASAAGDGPETP